MGGLLSFPQTGWAPCADRKHTGKENILASVRITRISVWRLQKNRREGALPTVCAWARSQQEDLRLPRFHITYRHLFVERGVCFYRSSVPGFPTSRCRQRIRMRFSLRKPHDVDQRHGSQQEIRVWRPISQWCPNESTTRPNLQPCSSPTG